jgi:hypothetical protein
LLLPLFLVACVSSTLAKSNLDSVTALGQVAIVTDPVNEPEASAAVTNANAIVDAVAPIQQIIHLGVPQQLVDDNVTHINNLAAVVDVKKPDIKAKVELAKANGAKLRDRVVYDTSLWATAKSLPWTDQAIALLTALGSTVGLIYGATRGKTHLADWWNSTPETAPAAVKKTAPGDIAS